VARALGVEVFVLFLRPCLPLGERKKRVQRSG
jgi:hypothetical protein